ncbi:MAG: helix-turn-helix domain-containing protein [Pseudonocardiales bacterium]|nr:helix-turn-helix domain-containing protein [Pseudonocardiales bacterium]
MAVRNDPSALRWLIGHELRRARVHSQRTQVEAAKTLGCTPAKINYLEIGRNQQHPDEVTALMQLYGSDAADIDRLATLAGRADQGTWWAAFSDVLPNWFKTFVGLEGLAQAAFVYDTMLLSGQLQTKEYATALLEDNLRVSRAEAGQVVRARLARQRLTDNGSPLRYHTVLEEAVLDRVVGGPAVMRAQLERLLDLGEQDNVTLQVLPTAVAVHDGLAGPFMLLDFAEARSIGYIEYRNGAVYVQDQGEVEVYNLVAERLSVRALSDADSADLIRVRIASMT